MKKTLVLLLMILILLTACNGDDRETNPPNTGNDTNGWVNTSNIEKKTDNSTEEDTNGIIDDETVSPEASENGDIVFENILAAVNITPQDIEKLYKEQLSLENQDEENLKSCMDYICRSLGIDEWPVRPPDRVERKQLKLNGENSYTVLEFSGASELRMLIFKQNSDGMWEFIDYIDFGGKNAGIGYSLKKLGNSIFVVGNSCKGYGTGLSIYNREWYLVSDEGKKMVLSYPFDDHSVGPYGGYMRSEKNMKLSAEGDLKLTLDFDVSRIYNLELDIADEYGQIELHAEMKAEFVWDDGKKEFSSPYPVDDSGVTNIPVESPVFTQKCDEILDMYYDKLLESIDAIQKEDTREWKARGINMFLEDCSDGKKKSEVLRNMEEAFPELADR